MLQGKEANEEVVLPLHSVEPWTREGRKSGGGQRKGNM